MSSPDYGMMIKRICDAIGKRGNEQLKSVGITHSQMRFLMHIHFNEKSPVPLKDFEKRFKVSQPTVAGIISRLLKIGLIEIQKCNFNSKSVYLTEKGKQVCKACMEYHDNSEEWIVHSLDEKEKTEFFMLLQKVYNSLEEEKN